ncbi:ankyrin repeat-containing domain protein [Halteromyces radiatus]|uniref:ankyrin repeat-containing domain protein n=1 Tax=Halteromyces radiatus TaxID=101107 RepID=UPI0022205024|nr:ankyrin repeat-containing domain protein [Halteromyces radiatus]KAI8099120.1 ankyrin repeat-containing domain protein [Halteromyces radiatus]
MIASLKGEFSIVRCLVDHGALLDLTSKDGRTALHMAVQEGHAEVAEYLASCCPSSMYVETKSGRIPIQMAAALTSERQMAGDRMTRYFISLSGTSRMLAHMDRSGRTVLEDAVVANQIELVKWLIQEHGATPERLDALGRNGWHHAAMMGHVTMIQQLQALTTTNTSLDQADTWDLWTPLMYAAKNGHLDCVRCLLELRADKTKKDKLGRTAKDLGK